MQQLQGKFGGPGREGGAKGAMSGEGRPYNKITGEGFDRTQKGGTAREKSRASVEGKCPGLGLITWGRKNPKRLCG